MIDKLLEKTFAEQDLLYIFPTSIYLALNVFMLFDVYTGRSISPLTDNIIYFLLAFTVATLILSSIQLFLVLRFFVFMYNFIANIHVFLRKSVLKRQTVLATKTNPFTYDKYVFFSFMVMPTILFGLIFPDFINQSALQPFFTQLFCGISLFFFIVGYLFYYDWLTTECPEKIAREHK
ncbi:hypothetical protein ACFL4F_01055 [Candidatus Margulisiibacteriota bacterium]